MWFTVLMLALWMSTDPVRIFIGTFLVSRPNPLQNLISYWLGGMTGGLVASLFVIVLLRDFALPIMKTVTASVSHFTGGYVRVVLGVLALMLAVKLAVNLVAKARQRVGIPMNTTVSASSAAVSPGALQTRPSLARPSLAQRQRALVQRCTPEVLTRFSTGIMDTLGSGSPRLSFVAGLLTALPPVEHQAALTAIMASGAGVAEQMSASIVFVLVVLTTLEVIFITYWLAPSKTQQIIGTMQTWIRSTGQKLLPFTATVGGVFLLYTGLHAI